MALYETLLSNKTDGKKIKTPSIGGWYGKVLNGGTRIAYDKVPVFYYISVYIYI